MNLDEFTRALVELRRAGHAYRVVEQAHRALPTLACAPDLALLTLETLLELGLGGPAREVLQMRGDLPSDHPSLVTLRAWAAVTPNGRIAWRELAPAFERNSAALRRARPDMADLLRRAAELLSAVHLYRTTCGGYQLSTRAAGALRFWWPALTLPEHTPISLPERGETGPVAVIGARVSPVLERLYRDTYRRFLTSSHPLWLIEPDPVYFAAWLHVVDAAGYLGDPRVHCCVGPEAVEQFERCLLDEPALALPSLWVNQSGDPEIGARVQQTTQSASRLRGETLQALARELRERYADRGPAYWTRRWREPGLVLAVTSRFTTVLQYSTRDALAALERLGFATRLVIEQSDHHQLSSINMCRAVLEHDPDMILVLDHLRYEYPHLPANLPFLSWIQDPLPNLLCGEAGQSVGPLDFVCGYFRDRCVNEFGYPPDAFEYADIPVSTTVFHDGDVDAALRKRWAADIVFVSNGSMPLHQLFETEAAAHPPQLRLLFESLYHDALAILARDEPRRLSELAEELTANQVERLGIPLTAAQRESLATNYTYRLLDWGRRQQTLEWVAGWARSTGRVLRIYGRGWESHPTLAEFAGGTLEHGEDLRVAYRTSKLALQLIPSGFWHQRSYEMLAAGTLPLTRHCPDDFDFLPMDEFIRRRELGERLGGAAARFPGLERIVFRTPAEFAALAERFLRDDSHREQVRQDLRAVVLRDYTYDATLTRIMNAFRTRLERLGSDARCDRPTEHMTSPAELLDTTSSRLRPATRPNRPHALGRRRRTQR